jgi:hypothetical protein
VFQAGHLLPELPAVENVAVPLMLAGRPRAASVVEAAQLFPALGLQGLEKRRPGELSGGQAQRVAIARAMVARPGIVFADEPTGALDQGTSAYVMRLLTAVTKGAGAPWSSSPTTWRSPNGAAGSSGCATVWRRSGRDRRVGSLACAAARSRAGQPPARRVGAGGLRGQYRGSATSVPADCLSLLQLVVISRPLPADVVPPFVPYTATVQPKTSTGHRRRTARNGQRGPEQQTGPSGDNRAEQPHGEEQRRREKDVDERPVALRPRIRPRVPIRPA